MLPRPVNDGNSSAYADDGEYVAPGTSSDAVVAAELQKAEQMTAGAAKMMEKIVKEDAQDKKSNNIRTARSMSTM